MGGGESCESRAVWASVVTLPLDSHPPVVVYGELLLPQSVAVEQRHLRGPHLRERDIVKYETKCELEPSLVGRRTG